MLSHDYSLVKNKQTKTYSPVFTGFFVLISKINTNSFQIFQKVHKFSSGYGILLVVGPAAYPDCRSGVHPGQVATGYNLHSSWGRLQPSLKIWTVYKCIHQCLHQVYKNTTGSMILINLNQLFLWRYEVSTWPQWHIWRFSFQNTTLYIHILINDKKKNKNLAQNFNSKSG